MATRADDPDAVAVSPWTVTASRNLLKDRWISVRADDCVTREGVSIAPFYVLEYPDWVQVVALDAAGDLIMIEQYRHGLGVISLELPTGGMDAGEDPLRAGQRELGEETGYAASAWRHVASIGTNPASHNNRCHIMLAQNAAFARPPADDPTERLRVVTMPVAAAVRRALAGEIVQPMAVAALALALTPLGLWKP